MVEKRPMTEIGSGPVTLGPANRKEPKMGEPTITPALREQVKVEAVKLVDEAIARREAKQTLAVASTPAMCGQLKENAMRAVAKGLKEEGAVSTVIAGSQLAHELGGAKVWAGHEEARRQGLKRRANDLEAGTAPTSRQLAEMGPAEFKEYASSLWLDICPSVPH